MLIFVNGFTDAPNAITTVVSTKVLSFKKSALLSAVFNVLGIIIMSYLNFKVASGISSIVNLKAGKTGLIALFSSIISCVIFSGVASLFGIPTSETHGLISGLAGSVIALSSFYDINIIEYIKVFIGLIWSVLGTFIIVKITYIILNKRFYKIKLEKIKQFQKYSSYLLSFAHGSQDGQKFIGLVILYISIINNSYVISSSPKDYVWIIIFVSIIMFFGVSLRWEKNCRKYWK